VVSLPNDLLSHLNAGAPLNNHKDPSQAATGIISLSEGPLLVASRPILPSRKDGAPRGILVLGRFLDDRQVDAIARQLCIEVQAFRPDCRLEGPLIRMKQSLDRRGGIVAGPLSQTIIAGCMYLYDMKGRPAVLLQAQMPRNIYRQGWHSVVLTTLCVTLIGLAFGSVSLFLLERMALARVEHLRAQVSRIGREGDSSARVALTGHDELSYLADNINTMLGALEKADLEKRRNEKLASVGQLAAGIAHEINTPIQYVSDNLKALSASFEDLILLEKQYRELVIQVKSGVPPAEALQEVDAAERRCDLDFILEDTPKAIGQSLEGAHRVAEIVRAMKGYTHGVTGHVRCVDINHVLQNTLILARHEYKNLADAETDFGDLPSVECFEGELDQVFLNLIVNAAHAIEESGKHGQITIRTRSLGNQVEIAISDTGPGIPPEIRDRIFDAFFTTKEVGKGTGQGLNISHQIVVVRHSGTLAFETEMGKGTTFRVRLPVKLPVREAGGNSMMMSLGEVTDAG